MPCAPSLFTHLKTPQARCYENILSKGAAILTTVFEVGEDADGLVVGGRRAEVGSLDVGSKG